MRDRSGLAAVGGIGAALAAGICCVGASLAAAGMAGAAGLAFAIEPLRPVLLVLAAVLLVFGFRLARKGAACDSDVCQPGSGGRTRSPRFLWVASGIALVFATLLLWIDMVK